MTFITLGTASGPDEVAEQSQPANALVIGNDVYLVDSGDGAGAQLAKAGYRLPAVKGLFLSHLHFDHTGGVLAILGLRMQLDITEPLRIYGPPGTQAFIDGLVTAMEPARKAAFGVPGRVWQNHLAVRELRAGDRVNLGSVVVTMAENTHYQSPEYNAAPGSVSLSYRFDGPDRAIVFTGDTGPSEAVTALAKNADLLVSEMMDIELALANIRRLNPGMPDPALQGLETHFRAHHISPEQVAAMANGAGVGAVVVTHFGPGITSAEQARQYQAVMKYTYSGPVTFANDLDRF
jgi:ribonuclease BN (tRNA processing enzyme)